MGQITLSRIRPLPLYLLFVLIILCEIIYGSPSFAAEKHSCIECHRELPEGTYVGHKYSDYTGSVHDRNQVRCEACHGGDPAATGRDAAHSGVYKSADPKSSVYYKNIPQTCGKCHGKELINFTRSQHYLMLKTSGRGPSCVTCHGSMGTFILNAWRIKEFCTICHNQQSRIDPDKPREAEDVLTLMEQTNTLLHWSEELVNAARLQGRNVADSEKTIESARKEMDLGREAWHTFKLNTVRLKLKETFDAAKKAKENLR